MCPDALPVVVMNETLARQSFGEANPIGQYVTGWNGDGETIRREVVGVVGDARPVYSHPCCSKSTHAIRLTFGTAALVLTSATLLAGLIPARRATRVEPLRSITGS